MTDREIRVHVDELEYTREGLRTTVELQLRAGGSTHVVVERATRGRAVPFGRAGFAAGSSFPNPATLPILFVPSLQRLFAPDGGTPVYQVFGHTERDGNEDGNKRLAEQRARAFVALMQGDVDMFESVAGNSDWGATADQLMLRALGCDPGPIDGLVEDLTRAGTRNFQIDYNGGVFHRHQDAEQRYRPLAVTGELDAQTSAALRESYVVAYSAAVAGQQFVPGFDAVGCGEFNLVRDAAAENHRVTLVVHGGLPRYHERAPCRDGDPNACPVHGDGATRCLWYAEHVDESRAAQTHFHYDLRWLRLSNGHVLLSALTSLADGEGCSFQVFRTKPVASAADIVDANLSEPLSGELSALVRSGVAQVVWVPPEGFFDAPGYEVDGVSLSWMPSVFRVVGGGAVALSQPPDFEVDRIELDQDSRGVAVLDPFGGLYLYDVANRRVAEQRAITAPDLARGSHAIPLLGKRGA